MMWLKLSLIGGSLFQLLCLSRAEMTRPAVVAYDMPPFALSFRSDNILGGAVEIDGVLLESTLGEPLKLILTEFLLDVFSVQLARSASDPEIPSIVWQFLKLHLHVDVHYQVVDSNGEAKGRRLSSSQADFLQFYAEFGGQALYREPTDPSTKPSSDLMLDLLGNWIDVGLSEDLSILKQRLLDSEQPLLQSHEFLSVETNVVAGSNPFTTPTQKNKSFAAYEIVVLVLVGLLVVTGLFLFRPRSRSTELSDGSFFPSRPDDIKAEKTLPGRHGEAMDAIKATDVYLSKHRPDLFAIETKPTSPMSTERSFDDPENLSSPSQFSQDSQAESDSCIDSTMDPGTGYTPVSTWFSKLKSSIGSSVSPSSQTGDGLVCDEDPNNYSFPFSDFPRQDGTPCLIYNNQDNAAPSVVQEGSPIPDSEYSTTSPGASGKPLSDEEFMLSLQAANSTFNEESFHQDSADDGDFKEKLKKLVAMKHRHYEKETIMNKARAARRQERRHTEARERDLKLRRHSMELDLEQIEADLTPPALSRKSSESRTFGEVAKKTHRIVSSDSNFFSNNSTLLELNAATKEKDDLEHAERLLRATGLNGKRVGAHGNQRLPLSPQLPRKPAVCPAGSVVASPTIRRTRSAAEDDKSRTSSSGLSPKRKTKYRRSHRRSNSHGASKFEETNGRKETHDVMTFGIAAYSDFI